MTLKWVLFTLVATALMAVTAFFTAFFIYSLRTGADDVVTGGVIVTLGWALVVTSYILANRRLGTPYWLVSAAVVVLPSSHMFLAGF